MESQASRFKEAIIDVLLKRIIPLEKQLEAQTEIIDELTNSLESLSKTLELTQDSSKHPIRSTIPKKSTATKYEQQKLNEEIKKEADIQEIRKAFAIEISKLNIEVKNEEKESI
jgi:hypothetical protein